MKQSMLGSVAVMSFIALTSAACSPVLSQPKAAMEPDVEVSTTSLTSAEPLPAAPLPANRAPLESWFRGTPAPAAATPVQPAVQPLDPWSHP